KKPAVGAGPERNQPLRSSFGALPCNGLYCPRIAAFPDRRNIRAHSADRFRISGNPRCGDFLASPFVIGGAAVADAIAGERPRTDERWRRRTRWICRRDYVPGGILPALLARLVGRNRGSVQVLQRHHLVREERRVRHASIRVALVELAADAASDRVLAELSQNGRRRNRVGRRKSSPMVGRADRD